MFQELSLAGTYSFPGTFAPIFKQEVKIIWQKAPHGGPIPRLGVTAGGRKLYHWIPGVGFPISVPYNYRPRMHRLATVHARDNQPTNDQRRHDTAYLNKRLFY